MEERPMWGACGVQASLRKLLDLVAVAAAFLISVALWASSRADLAFAALLEARITVLEAICVGALLGSWHVLMVVSGLYGRREFSLARRELIDTAAAATALVVLLAVWRALLAYDSIHPAFIVGCGALAYALMLGVRAFGRALVIGWRKRVRSARNVVIVHDGKAGIELSSRLVQQQQAGYNVVRVIDVVDRASGSTASDDNDAVAELSAMLDAHPVDEVLIALSLSSAHRLAERVIDLCEDQGTLVRMVAGIADPERGTSEIDAVNGKPVFTVIPRRPSPLLRAFKRTFDIVASAIGIIVLAPMLLAAAVAIRVDSRGPVLYVQERVGLKRRRFRFYKFRTMVVDAELQQQALEHLNEANGACFKIANDPRITRVGRWLRRFSIDELPQLFNVLKGDMSLVGPRPLSVRDAELIDVPGYRRRFSVSPGITCIWQVTTRQPIFDDWMRADMEYIDHWSPILDFKILARTLPAVVSGHGAH